MSRGHNELGTQSIGDTHTHTHTHTHMFELETRECSDIFCEWVNFLFFELGSYPIWGHRDIIRSKMPSKFKEDFPIVFGIVDCTEVKIERPSALHIQSMCWSEYKQSPTFKALVSVDPAGTFNFVSMLFSGAISDKGITNQCGFLRLLEQLIDAGLLIKGDEIMADKGFHICEEIEKLGLKLVMPPFARSGSQMAPADAKRTKKVARHRVVVEQAIGRAKKFKIISKKMKLRLFPVFNQIFFVCCILTNFKKPILS